MARKETNKTLSLSRFFTWLRKNGKNLSLLGAVVSAAFYAGTYYKETRLMHEYNKVEKDNIFQLSNRIDEMRDTEDRLKKEIDDLRNERINLKTRISELELIIKNYETRRNTK